MKILFTIGNGAFINSIGGMEKVACTMANELTDRGHKIAIVCNDIQSGVPAFSLNERVQLYNLNGTGHKLYRIHWFHRFLREMSHPFRNFRLTWFLRYNELRRKGAFFASRMKTVLDSEKPDVVLSFSYEDLYILPRNENGFERPVIQMFHLPPSWVFRFPDGHLLKMFQQCAFLQVLLPSFIDEIRRYDISKVVAIPNSVAEYEKGVEYKKEKGGRILFLGRIGIQKRPHLLLQAFSKIASKYPSWSLHFYGTGQGHYYEQVRKLERSLHLESQIVFHGTTDKVESVMRASDIFAFPSSFEGFGLSLVEAMSIGLSCVGCRCAPAVNELIHDEENGLLADDGADSFAQKLELLIVNPELRAKLGNNARQFAQSFKQSVIMDSWENLFHKVY